MVYRAGDSLNLLSLNNNRNTCNNMHLIYSKHLSLPYNTSVTFV